MNVLKVASEMNKALKLVPEICLDNKDAMLLEIEDVCKELTPGDLSVLSKVTVSALLKQEFFPKALLEDAYTRIGKKMPKITKDKQDKTTKPAAKDKGSTKGKASKKTKAEAKSQPKSVVKLKKEVTKKKADVVKPKKEATKKKADALKPEKKPVNKQKKESNVQMAVRMLAEGVSFEKYSTALEQSYIEKGKTMSKEWYSKRASIYWAIAKKEAK